MLEPANKDALLKILNSGNIKECLEFFHGMPEKTRREYFPVVKSFWSLIKKNSWIESPPGTFKSNPLENISQVAFFSTANWTEIRSGKRSAYPDDESVIAILADRKPAWIDDWVATLLNQSYYWGHWRLIRRLMQLGLAKKPDTPRYYLGMISALNRRLDNLSLLNELSAESDVLTEDIWKLFEYDGDGENSLANTERFGHSWIDAFVQLMNMGRLPRHRLLESSVAALERDFNHYRAKWFYEFFDRLAPTDEELKEFADRLLGLLGVSAPNVASWALRRVEVLAASACFETAAICHAIVPILRSRAKGNAISALRLLERQAVAFPKDAHLVSSKLAIGLEHGSTEVQKEAIRILQLVNISKDESVLAAVAKLQPTVAASLRGAVAELLAANGHTSIPSRDRKRDTAKASVGELPSVPAQLDSLFALDQLRSARSEAVFKVPAAIFDGTEIARLNVVEPLTPIDNLEDLIDVCARVIEDGSLVDDAERCIDGMARLCGAKPANFEPMTAPLLKRVRTLILKDRSPFCGIDPANEILGLFYAFCTGVVVAPTAKQNMLRFEFEGKILENYGINTRKPIGFLVAFCVEVARRIAVGQASQLLSTPTHRGGWIDPRILANRVSLGLDSIPLTHDLILAMLRLAPEHRPAALKQIDDRSEEWVQAIRYAVGAETSTIGNSGPLWVAASRSRSAWCSDAAVMKKHPGLGPDAAEAATLTFECKQRRSAEFTFYSPYFVVKPSVPESVDPLVPTVAMHACRDIGNLYSFEMGGFGGRTIGSVRWTSMIWPLARDSYLAASASECLSNLDWNEAQWQNRTMLEPLLDAGTPLREPGALFLAGMLAAKEPGESGLAIDIAILTIQDGRLGSDNFGPAMNELFWTGLIKPGRWQKNLAVVAQASPVHSAVIQLALQACFVKSASKSAQNALPKDSVKLLELLYELSIDLKIPLTNQACRGFLSTGSFLGGKSVKLAKSLLDLSETPESHAAMRSVVELALKHRSQAASRFSS